MLEAHGLIKHLGGRRVVDGVDLVCMPGEIHGLLGPNGAGKTTTLRMLYGFLTPDGGDIRIEGVDTRDDLEAAKRFIGVCTQEDTFDGDFTVEQNLLVAAEYFRPRPTGLRARVGHLLDRFELRPFARQRPETLSGGFRRRLMLARAIVPDSTATTGTPSSAIRSLPLCCRLHPSPRQACQLSENVTS